jgi:phospholipid-translocating ATPase
MAATGPRQSSFSRAPLPGVRSLTIGKPIEPFDKKLHTNVVITSRYNFVSFLPFNLFEQVITRNYAFANRSKIFLQFQRFANFFYLIISIISFNRDIWPAGPVANIGPLLFVLSVTALKEGIEDYNRHKADAAMNGTAVKVLDGGTWIDSTWAQVACQLRAFAHVSLD